MAEWAHYSTPDAEWTETVTKIGGIPAMFQDTDLVSRRTVIHEMMRKRVEGESEETLKGIKVEEKRIPVFHPEGEIPIRIYTPDSENPEETFPVLLDFHGGGYCLGTLDTDEIKCRLASQKHRIIVVNVDYRLAPEFPWPTGINDSYDALKWVVDHAAEIRADLKKGCIVNGLSAGAMFAIVLTHRARADPAMKDILTGQILQIPPTCHAGPDGYPEKFKDRLLSYEQNKDDPILNRNAIKLFLDSYNASPATHLEVSPLLAESFEGLPPAYVQIAGADPLRDEGLCYSQCLEDAGVPVIVDIYPGVPHGFANYFPGLKLSQKWSGDFDKGVQWLLQKAY